ncbi:MAG: hypothetical protein QOC59_865, partial [Microbacteriaceae bacterium]|nr:hypothetical protein [Microbacteriaceae bacterium]
MEAMADERAVGGRTSAPDPGIHDDDELADALAAELDHLAATGAVPVIRMPMPRPDPTPEPASAPPAPRSASASQPAAPQPASA